LREAPALAPPDLPTAPRPQTQAQNTPAPESLRPAPQAAPDPSHGLILPRFSSPGRELEESAQEALHGGGAAVQSGGAIPGSGSGLPGQGGGGGGEGTAGAGIQMLTPTEGVDFTSYLARVLASVKRNWYAVMPESAQLGDKGRVVLQFRIERNGAVPDGEPQLENGSGKEPLDRAAMSSIRSSSPFEPLPGAFSSPYIELRFIFLYNLPLNYQ
jgi:TonB family protein